MGVLYVYLSDLTDRRRQKDACNGRRVVYSQQTFCHLQQRNGLAWALVPRPTPFPLAKRAAQNRGSPSSYIRRGI